jgi:hypothetical protein
MVRGGGREPEHGDLRRVARAPGGYCFYRLNANRKPENFLQRGRVMATRRGYGAHQRPVALCAWAGQA